MTFSNRPRVNVPLVVVLVVIVMSAFGWWARGRGLKTWAAHLVSRDPAQAPLVPVGLEIRPQNGEGDVRPDITIEARLKFPGTGIDTATLLDSNMTLYRTSDRAKVPVMLSETNLRGSYLDRLTWLKFMEEQCETLARELDFRGFCWYPSIDSTDWCHLCTKATGTVDPQGIWRLDRNRWKRHASEVA